MIKRILAINAVVGAAVMTVSIASAEPPPTPQQQAEKAVKTRQGLFDVQAFAFGPVGAMLKGAPVDAAAAQKAGARIQVTAGMIPEVFQLDTRNFQLHTKARQGIWNNASDFDKKADALHAAAAALENAAKTGNSAAILAAADKVGGACKSCHDDFREK